MPRRITVLDVILILAVVASAAPFLARLWHSGAGRPVACVFHEGRLVQALPLDRDQTADVPGTGEQVQVEVRAGRIRIARSDCPGQVCVRTGWVSRPGQTIVCAPRKLLIQVAGVRPEYDAETR